LINEAYLVLNDPIKRKDYDLELLTRRSSSSWDPPFSFTRSNENFKKTPNYDSKRDSPVGGGRRQNYKNRGGWDTFF
jgi:curved DNA-binding protein CbpA